MPLETIHRIPYSLLEQECHGNNSIPLHSLHGTRPLATPWSLSSNSTPLGDSSRWGISRPRLLVTNGSEHLPNCQPEWLVLFAHNFQQAPFSHNSTIQWYISQRPRCANRAATPRPQAKSSAVLKICLAHIRARRGLRFEVWCVVRRDFARKQPGNVSVPLVRQPDNYLAMDTPP